MPRVRDRWVSRRRASRPSLTVGLVRCGGYVRMDYIHEKPRFFMGFLSARSVHTEEDEEKEKWTYDFTVTSFFQLLFLAHAEKNS